MKKQILFLLLFCSTFLTGQSRFTTFDVNKHGFKFTNRFKSSVGDAGSIKITTSGLCGGMSYAAADYFFARKSSPNQSHIPAIGTRLHQYIYNRQLNSFQSLDKWAELTVNPFGSRDEEFFYWGLERRLYVDLKKSIDKNKPVPLGLFNIKNDMQRHHQVLAIGYDMGGYKNKRDKDPKKKNVRIFIYDPNYPKTICALFPNPKNKCYDQYKVKMVRGKCQIIGKVNKQWRTYFIDENYRKSSPPRISNSKPKPSSSNLVSKLLIDIKTGGDDLRGGNDNVNICIALKGGKEKRQNCVNRKHRWPDNNTQTVEIRLDKPIEAKDILGVRLETTFKGGMGGDNWNVDYLRVQAVKKNGKKEVLLTKHGKPLKRFTADRKTYYSKTKYSK